MYIYILPSTLLCECTNCCVCFTAINGWRTRRNCESTSDSSRGVLEVIIAVVVVGRFFSVDRGRLFLPYCCCTCRPGRTRRPPLERWPRQERFRAPAARRRSLGPSLGTAFASSSGWAEVRGWRFAFFFFFFPKCFLCFVLDCFGLRCCVRFCVFCHCCRCRLASVAWLDVLAPRVDVVSAAASRICLGYGLSEIPISRGILP